MALITTTSAPPYILFIKNFENGGEKINVAGLYTRVRTSVIGTNMLSIMNYIIVFCKSF